MIVIFLRVGKPTNWVTYRLEVGESDAITSIEGPLPLPRYPKVGWGINNLNDWCLSKPYRHVRFACDGFYRRSLRHYDVGWSHARAQRSYIRQFWITETGKRLMSAHPFYTDVLQMPSPMNLKEGTMRDGLPHLIDRIGVPVDIPMNLLGELGPSQM